METDLEKELDQVMEGEGVIGVICCDADGLCLGVRGKAARAAAGHVRQLISSAYVLSSTMTKPEDSYEPVVRVSLPEVNILVQRYGPITLAIFKSSES
mmetsp:Transcript_26255/g.102699  ORF Transcript_26255/g.102699 Transcript_26255/m.102699 type:complete len:98 (-) Transcript_26255:321-614(-)|eukprot:CAMPEP_0113968246 /NCGR_PEP_ID=MMETSP0011_2-20120614/9413_1 /TAXON_ID=101924 /ORGANISM="Rhodosorus marinus" /LENGTH=97 /DNA_ID=CAMNT_0000981287 /DNA_START=74 /DNA_END=367 /DNA_ORIENTATION=- /assembly_acc=CAM_ASM_000156